MFPEQESFAPSALAPHPHSGSLQPIHMRSPSDPTLLLPYLMLPTSPTGSWTSLDVPYSPSSSYVSSDEGSSMMALPSLTLSTRSSVHFTTSVALHNNKSGDGSTSLNLLNINNAGSHNKHSRKASWASSGEGHSSLKGTEPDHRGIGLKMMEFKGSLTMRTMRITQYSLQLRTSRWESMGRLSFHIGLWRVS